MRRVILLAPLLLLAGCQLEGDGPIVMVINEVLQTQLLTLVRLSITLMVLYGIAGLFGGFGIYVGLRRLGAYRWGWKHSKWLRRLVGVCLVVCGGVTGCTIGLIEGIADGFEVVLHKSQLATDVFPHIGDVGADFVAVYYLEVPPLKEGKPFEFPQVELAAFRRGEWELDIAKLAELSDMDDETIDRIVTELEDEALQSYPDWRGGMAERALHDVLVILGTALAGRSSLGKTQLGYRKLVTTMEDAVKTLPEAAKAEGDPNTLSRQELSNHVVHYGVVPTIMIPAEALAHGYQRGCFYLYLLVVFVPIPFFRIAEWIRRRRERASKAADPPQPAAPEAPASDAPAPTPTES